jgi:hypothetical protein
MLSAIPVALGLAVEILAVLGATNSGLNWGLLVLLSAVDGGAFAAAAMAWNFAARRAHEIDSLMSVSRVRDIAVKPLYWAMPARRQLVLPILLSSVPFAVAAIRVLWGGGSISIGGWALCGAVAWTLFIVGNDIWWLLVPPLVIWRLRRQDDLKLIWHDPARTPGIRVFAEGYGFSAAFLVIGAIVVVLPGVPWATWLGPTVPFLYFLLLILSLWIGIMTQVVIYQITRRARLRALSRLALADPVFFRQSRRARQRKANTSFLADSLSSYAVVAATSNLPYGSAVVVQYVSAVIGSLIGFALQTM